MATTDRDALMGLLSEHHGDITEPVRDDGAIRCLCGQWVAWDAWEEHLADVIEAHYAEKVAEARGQRGEEHRNAYLDEREALAKVIYADDVNPGWLAANPFEGLVLEDATYYFGRADAILAAGFRQGPVSVSREQVEAIANRTLLGTPERPSRNPWSDRFRRELYAFLGEFKITVAD